MTNPLNPQTPSGKHKVLPAPKVILVVEDNAMNLDLMTSLLEAHDFTVLSARNGADGVDMALEQVPDLILMDVSLPGMNGLEAVNQLKAHPITEDIPVVAVTAHALANDRRAAFRAGCVAFMTKPIDTRTLIKEINNVLVQEGKTMRLSRKSGLHKTRRTTRAPRKS